MFRRLRTNTELIRPRFTNCVSELKGVNELEEKNRKLKRSSLICPRFGGHEGGHCTPIKLNPFLKWLSIGKKSNCVVILTQLLVLGYLFSKTKRSSFTLL